MPDLTRRFGVMPDLARRLIAERVRADWVDADRLGQDGLGPQRLRPAVAAGDNWRDGTPDPERAEPLLGPVIT
jgi:hypothetical protein